MKSQPHGGAIKQSFPGFPFSQNDEMWISDFDGSDFDVGKNTEIVDTHILVVQSGVYLP